MIVVYRPVMPVMPVMPAVLNEASGIVWENSD